MPTFVTANIISHLVLQLNVKMPDTSEVQGAEEAGRSFLRMLIDLQTGTRQHYVDQLGTLSHLLAVALLAAGLIFMLQGWKIFKIWVVANAALAGMLVGEHLGRMVTNESQHNMPLYAGIAGGALLAILAWPLMKWAVSVMGAIFGAFQGYGIWCYVAAAMNRPDPKDFSWVGILIGLITMGLLAFIVFRQVVIISTAFEGSVMAVSGLLALLLLPQSPWHEQVRTALTGNIHMLPLMIALPTVIGYAVQISGGHGHPKKEKKE